ncbi:hypothetical protein G7Y89_g11567 [Cudoniella acicularis]|uniref:Methyltransferase type 11 domain-containing protein n=1 Tax=Cudoniella acicularis TaxID=354080 RepID=A0A8H4VXW5_9HELO|nr:hypothetical protein G7Y89_g11567 [Cudoniella acicularis]
MFDISWTDPKRETVGQRKSRKEQHNSGQNVGQNNGQSSGPDGGQASGNTGVSRGSSVRSSGSTQTSPDHTRLTLLSLLGGRKGGLARRGSHSKPSALKNDEATKASRRVSSYTVASDSSIHEPSKPGTTTTRILANGFFADPPYDRDSEFSSTSEAAESVFSARTGRSTATQSSWGSMLDSPPRKTCDQPMSPNTFATRGTDITTSPRDGIQPAEQASTVFHVSATETIPFQAGDSPTNPATPSTYDFPIPHLKLPEIYTKPIVRKPVESRYVERRDSEIQENRCSAASQAPSRQDSWEPLMAWEYPEMRPNLAAPKLMGSPFQTTRAKRQRPPPELSHLQRTIRRMEAASAKIILERLKEEWMEVADASVYRELELEKQRWMLFALRDLKAKTGGSLESTLPTTEPVKVLSLFENHASASFLTALTSATEVHHLSSNPLSPKCYPNIHPLLVTGPTSQLPYAPNQFSSVSAFSLPALFPAASLPQVLKECHRTLLPNGTLHLTILDPSPLPSTLGPRLRAWLDDHLILHLEKQFRCINPSRLFPAWLQDVDLRAEGSTRLTVPFLASVNAKEVEGLLDKNSITNAKIGVERGQIAKQELKSVVGRMLWKEMWGGYVQAEKWWWEDASIIEECERMRTCWEYVIIDAVKRNASQPNTLYLPAKSDKTCKITQIVSREAKRRRELRGRYLKQRVNGHSATNPKNSSMSSFTNRNAARSIKQRMPAQSLVSVVYVTAEPTFSGPIGGYTVATSSTALSTLTLQTLSGAPLSTPISRPLPSTTTLPPLTSAVERPVQTAIPAASSSLPHFQTTMIVLSILVPLLLFSLLSFFLVKCHRRRRRISANASNKNAGEEGDEIAAKEGGILRNGERWGGSWSRRYKNAVELPTEANVHEADGHELFRKGRERISKGEGDVYELSG